MQNTSNVIDWINKVQFGRLTLQGFGPSYNPCKKGKYKALVLVTFYQNQRQNTSLPIQNPKFEG